MENKSNPKLTRNAQNLRKNMTREERHLWYDFLKSAPVPFHRQKVIGRYIADFYCHSAGIVIELDGSQHYEESGKESDAVRDAYFKENGITVLRYSNLEVNTRFQSVCRDILEHLGIEKNLITKK